jgi:hypothetical protein
MTDRHKAIMALIALQTAKATVDQETARQTLIDEGIYDKDGNLTPEYGGPQEIDLSEKVTKLEVLVSCLNRQVADQSQTISKLRGRLTDLEIRVNFGFPAQSRWPWPKNHDQWTQPPAKRSGKPK